MIENMAVKLYSATVLILIFIYCCDAKKINIEHEKIVNKAKIPGRKGNDYSQKYFTFYKSNPFNERSCDCITETKCSCCESVMILSMRTYKRLCANFIYQNNGLIVNISLGNQILRAMTVSTYRPFTMCMSIPGSFFSTVCLNVLELNKFPQSITACAQLNIKTRAQNWELNYRCISISTVLPAIDKGIVNSNLPIVSTRSPSTAMNNQITSVTPAPPLPSFVQIKSLPPIKTNPNEKIQLNSSMRSSSKMSSDQTHSNTSLPLV